MNKFELGVIFSAGGPFPRQVQSFGRGISKFSRDGQRSLALLNRGAASAGRGLDRLGNRYTALLSGAAVAGTGRMLVDLQTRFERLGIQANISTGEVGKLKDEIYAASQQPNIRIDPSEMTAAVEKIVEKTGDLDLARNNLENIGLALSATGAAGQDIGAMVADMAEKFGLKQPEQFRQTLDAIVAQGKQGAFTLQNLATQGERVTAAYGSIGREGPGAVREMGAMLQMIKRGVGGPEQAATAFEALLRTLQDAEGVKKLTGAGITIMDPEDPKRMRSVIEIVKDIVRATGGDKLKLSQVFDSEAMRAFNGAIIEYQKTGGFASFDKFLNVVGDGNELLNDSARIAGKAQGALNSLATAGKRFADENLTGPIQGMADALNDLDAGELKSIMNTLAGAAAVGGGLILLSKGIRTAAAVKTLFGGRKSAGQAMAGADAGGLSGPMPVMVMNWPAGGMMGAAGMAAGKRGGYRGGKAAFGRGGAMAAAGTDGRALFRGGRAASMLSRSGGLLKNVFGKAAMPLFLAMTATDALGSAVNGDVKGVGRSLGGLSGSLAGASAGAALGSVVPGIGTAIGGMLGAMIGGFGGEELGDLIGGYLKIQIDSDGTPKIKEMKSNSRNFDFEAEVGTGMNMAP